MTVLIVRISALGDVAMTIPAIYSFASQYPSVQIKILTHSRFASVFIGPPSNISFIKYEKERHHGIRGLMRLLKQLNKEDIDAVADFHNVLRSWLIDIFFLLKGRKVGILRKERMKRRNITGNKNKLSRCKPFTLRYFDVLERIGFPTKQLFTPFGCKDHPYGLTSVRNIGIAPFARYKNKTYPPDKMWQVVDILAKEEDTHIYLFGGKGTEQAVLENWADRHGNVTCVAGSMPIEKEILLIGTLDVILTMDSANMHIASLAGTPVVSVWGSTTPECGFLGWKQLRENCIVAGFPCQPCTISGSNSCRYGDFHCLTALPPQHLCDYINRVINPQRQ